MRFQFILDRLPHHCVLMIEKLRRLIQGKVANPQCFGRFKSRLPTAGCLNQKEGIDWLNLIAVWIGVEFLIGKLQQFNWLNLNSSILFKLTLDCILKRLAKFHITAGKSPITGISPLLQQYLLRFVN